MTVGVFPCLLEEILQLRNLFVRKLASIFVSYFEGCTPKSVTREEEIAPGARLQYSPDQLGAEFSPVFQVFIIDKSEFWFWWDFLAFFVIGFVLCLFVSLLEVAQGNQLFGK